MVFSGRRMKARNSQNEGKESLLVKPDPSVSVGGSSQYNEANSVDSNSFEGSMKAKPFGQHRQTASLNSRLENDSRFIPHHIPYGSRINVKEEIAPEEGVLQFVPAFDETVQSQQGHARPGNVDTSWDAILEEGAAAFPQQAFLAGVQSQLAGRSRDSVYLWRLSTCHLHRIRERPKTDPVLVRALRWSLKVMCLPSFPSENRWYLPALQEPM